MTLKLSERELEDLLRQPGKKPKPPADLLARLRADLPAELEMAPPAPLEPAPSSNVLRPARWTRPLISLAASLAVLAGGSLIAYRGFRDSALPAPASEAAAVAAQDLPALAPPEKPPEKLREELKAKQEQALPAEAPRIAPLRADAGGGRSFNLESRGLIVPVAPKKDALPLPVAEQLKVEKPPAPPSSEGIATGADGGLLLDAKEREAAAAPDRAASETTALREDALPAAPPAALQVPPLENPGIEANRQQPMPEPQAFGELDKRKETRRLESPATQGDFPRPELSRAAAAAPKQVDRLTADGDLGDAWRRIERDLAGGGWPGKEALAAAREPRDAENAAPAARAAPRGAELAADPSAQLREDLLDFLDRRDHGRRVLYDLRRRAIRLAEKRPDDERISSVLRIINLAIKLSPD